MDGKNVSFSEMNMIQLNLALLTLSISIFQFSDDYFNINDIMVLSGSVGFLVTIIGFYMFHIRKMGLSDQNYLLIKYATIMQLNIISITFMISGIDLEEYQIISLDADYKILLSPILVYIIVYFETYRVLLKKDMRSDKYIILPEIQDRFDRKSKKLGFGIMLFCESILWCCVPFVTYIIFIMIY